jgi:hypothetical protein
MKTTIKPTKKTGISCITLILSKREQQALQKSFTFKQFKAEVAKLERDLKKQFPGKVKKVRAITRRVTA